jgi:hypothetical protein
MILEVKLPNSIITPVGIADNGPEDEHSATYWKDKYLVLLEKYNDLLEKQAPK